MNEEINLFGIFMPSVLLCAILSYVVMVVFARALRAIGAYRFIWHRSLFNLSMFVCILCVTVLFLSQAQS